MSNYIRGVIFLNEFIFKGLSDEEKESICADNGISELSFKKGEILNKDIESGILIVDSGMVQLKSVDDDGNENILLYAEKNDIITDRLFGFAANTNSYIKIIQDTKMTYIRHDKLKNGDSAIKVLNNIFRLYEETSKKIMQHTAVVMNRSIRRKLCEFFEQQRKEKKSVKFKIPLTMTELSYYIGAERTAMMREIKKMRDEGLITSQNRVITILK